MAECWRGQMKRKVLEEAYDEFSDFPLSSPAIKIRRLDADLPAIMEDSEPASTMVFDQQLPQGNISDGALPSLGSVASEDMSTYPSSNEERAIVLYKPVETPAILSSPPTNVALSFSSDFINGLKNHVFEPGNRRFNEKDDKTYAKSSCLALVPWVPPEASTVTSGFSSSELGSELLQDPMEAEEAEASSMEVEEMRGQSTAYDVGVGGEGVQQWPQHCMSPQFLPNTASPIMWSW